MSSFTLHVADSAGATANIPAVINIAPQLSVSVVSACAQYCVVEIGCTNVCGKFGQLSGGVAPYTYSVAQGPLPVGTSLSGLTLKGTFAGQPGYLQFTVQVKDALGATDTVSPTFWVYQHIALAGDATTCFYIWTDCAVQLKITGGVPIGRPSVALVGESSQGPDPVYGGCWDYQLPTPLSAGYTLTVSNGYVNLFIPRPTNGYGGLWKLVLTDHTLCSAATYCTSAPASARIGINCT